MKHDKIKLEERFTDVELARMFTVECAPSIDHKDGARTRNVDAPYVFNDVKVPLWTLTKKKQCRGEKAALQIEDKIRDGVSKHPPGSQGRIEDLMAHYDGVDAETHESVLFNSAFSD